MFSGFKRSLPQVSIFHHPTSFPSIQALALLRSSLSSPYPPHKRDAQPLDFNLDVIESTPTPDQLHTILSYLPPKTSPPSLSTFISAHPASPAPSEYPQSVDGVSKLAASNPNALKWPIVVDWTGGRASVGDVDGVKGILEAIRRQRDGEGEGDDVVLPKGWFS